VRHLGQVVALLDVLLLDLLGVLPQRGVVQDRADLQVDGALEVVLGELLGALVLHLADGGPLGDPEHQGRALLRALGLDDDVGEVAELHQRPEVRVHLVAVERLAGLAADGRLDGVGLHPAVPLHPDRLDARLLGVRLLGSRRGCQRQEKRSEGGDLGGEPHGGAQSSPCG
jgi:hypothetical protein